MHSTDLAISFFTFLTVLANLATAGIAVLAVGARAPTAIWAAPARRWWPALRAELTGSGLEVAWLVAAVATSGSLWFSEVAGFQPCRLCWAQRACMYPLVAVLAVAAVAQRHAVARLGAAAAPAATSLPSADPATARARVATVAGRVARWIAVALAGVGAVIAAYHVVIERFPSLEAGACDPQVPCTVVWFERLGFITLPYMALSGFVLILVLLGTSRPQRDAPSPTHHDIQPEPQLQEAPR